MNKHAHPTYSEELVDEASIWIAKLDRGLNAQEKADLGRFLETPEATAVFLDIAGLSDRLDLLSKLADDRELPPVVARNSSVAYAMAAGIVFAVCIGLAFFAGGVFKPSPSAPHSPLIAYETHVGEQSIVKLADGSEVALNTDTRLRVLFSESGRLAVLDRGEAFFDVASDAYRPFSVVAGAQLVQAVGTSFAVYLAEAGVTEVVVTEGSVRVKTVDGSLLDGTKEELETPTLIVGGDRLTVGQEGVFGTQQNQVSELDGDSLEARLSWRAGKLVFRGESLEEALTDISRYTSARFVFLDESAKGISVAGVFRPGDVDGLLETLAANFGIAYQRLDGEQILISRR